MYNVHSMHIQYIMMHVYNDYMLVHMHILCVIVLCNFPIIQEMF